MYCSPEQITDEEGLAELGGTEAVVLGSLSTQIRSCIATCGGGGGAAARGDCWRYLFGFITIWLGERQYRHPLCYTLTLYVSVCCAAVQLHSSIHSCTNKGTPLKSKHT